MKQRITGIDRNRLYFPIGLRTCFSCRIIQFIFYNIIHPRHITVYIESNIQEIRDIIDTAYERARDILTEHMDQLHQVAQFLFEHEKMAENELLDNFKNWKYNQIDDEFTIDIFNQKVYYLLCQAKFQCHLLKQL